MDEEVTELKVMHRGGRCVQRLRRVELPRTFGEVGGGMRGQWQEEDGFSREQMARSATLPLLVGFLYTPHRGFVSWVEGVQ